MIDYVVVMGQLYGGKYSVDDFSLCRSILDALDQYCRNEEWNSISEGLLLNVCCLWSSSNLYYLIKEITGFF